MALLIFVVTKNVKICIYQVKSQYYLHSSHGQGTTWFIDLPQQTSSANRKILSKRKTYFVDYIFLSVSSPLISSSLLKNMSFDHFSLRDIGLVDKPLIYIRFQRKKETMLWQYTSPLKITLRQKLLCINRGRTCFLHRMNTIY